jgi:hypothetical protein
MDEETPWVPGPQHLGDMQLILASPVGVNHLGFNDGQWFQLTQHAEATRISAADAILLRPSDIDQVIAVTCLWTLRHPSDPRATQLIDGLGVGAKIAIRHLGDLAGVS